MCEASHLIISTNVSYTKTFREMFIPHISQCFLTFWLLEYSEKALSLSLSGSIVCQQCSRCATRLNSDFDHGQVARTHARQYVCVWKLHYTCECKQTTRVPLEPEPPTTCAHTRWIGGFVGGGFGVHMTWHYMHSSVNGLEACCWRNLHARMARYTFVGDWTNLVQVDFTRETPAWRLNEKRKNIFVMWYSINTNADKEMEYNLHEGKNINR